MSRTALSHDGGGHRLDAEDVEGAAQIVGERRQAELGAHIGEAAHQEGALIHPLLDAAEGMLNDLAATVENLRPLLQALGHAIEHGLVFEARNGAHVVRASRTHRAVTAGFRVAIVDLLEIAQPAVADRRQYLPGRADIGVAPRVVVKLVLAKEALADRGAALRSGNVRNATDPLTGLDVLDFEVAAIGDDIDRLDAQGLTGRLRGLRQQAHVHDLVGHRLLDDQLVLRVDRHLNVIPDGDLGVGGHGAAVRIGPRDLVLAGSLELSQHRLVAAALLAQRRDLLGQVLGARPGARPVRDIALVEPLEVVLQPLVGCTDERAQRRAGEVAVFVVDRLDAGSVDRQQLAAVEVEPPAQQHELAENAAKRRTIVAPKVGNRLKVGLQAAKQPDDLDVAATLALQPSARSDPVEVAVNVELQQVAG